MKNRYLKDTKGRLMSYDRWLVELQLRKDELNRLHDNVGIGGSNYDTLPACNNEVHSKVESIAIRNIQKERYLKDAIADLEEKIEQLDKGLNCLDAKQYEIIGLKYRKNNTWDYIADTTGYSVSRCKEIGKTALTIVASMVHGSKSFDLPLAVGQGYY